MRKRYYRSLLTPWQLRLLALCVFFMMLLIAIWQYYDYRIQQIRAPQFAPVDTLKHHHP